MSAHSGCIYIQHHYLDLKKQSQQAMRQRGSLHLQILPAQCHAHTFFFCHLLNGTWRECIKLARGQFPAKRIVAQCKNVQTGHRMKWSCPSLETKRVQKACDGLDHSGDQPALLGGVNPLSETYHEEEVRLIVAGVLPLPGALCCLSKNSTSSFLKHKNRPRKRFQRSSPCS